LTENNISIFGIYPSPLDSERGAADLISAGFPSPDISVLLADLRGKRDLATGAADATLGGLLSGALGILHGASARVICGVGPVVAAGPIAARLKGIDFAATQGLSGALLACGLPAEAASSYESRIQDGGTLLAVLCESPAQAKRAKQVLNSSGADHVTALPDSRAQQAETALI